MYNYRFGVVWKEMSNPPYQLIIPAETLWLAWCKVVEMQFGYYGPDLVSVTYIGVKVD